MPLPIRSHTVTLSDQILSATGNALYVNGVRVAETGSYYPLASNPSGYVTGSVVRPSETGGFITSSQTGNFVTTNQTGVYADAGNLASTGSNLQSQITTVTNWTGGTTGIFYPRTGNPSGFVTGSVVRPGDTGGFVISSQTGNLVDRGQTGNYVDRGQTGNYVDRGQTGSFVDRGQTGAFIDTGKTGQFAPAGLTGSFVTISQTGLFVDRGQTGVYADSGNLVTTGRALSLWTGITPTLFAPITHTHNYVTGITVSGSSAITGAIVLTGIGGINVILSGNTINISGGSNIITGNLIDTGMTGQFYPAGNPSNYISYSSVGGVQTLNVTGVPFSGAITITGSGNISLFKVGQVITISGNTGSLVAASSTGNFVDRGQTGSFITGNQNLGLPTDGVYGGSNGAIAGVAQGDRQEDAFDKVEVILGKLAPSKPQNLSAATFAFTNTTYSALMQGSATSYSSIMNTPFPTGRATGFYDGDAGILSGYINGILTGMTGLSTGSNIGNVTGLTVTADQDYWLGIAGKAGFWTYLSANVAPTGNLSTGKFTMQMGHSSTGPTAILTGYSNAVQTPSATIQAIVTGNPARTTIDGVPCVGVGGIINVKALLSNVVSAFYISSIGEVSSSQTNTITLTATGTPMSGENQILSGNSTVNSSSYTTGWNPSVIARNATPTNSSTANSGTNIRIDTVSSQPSNRLRAGSGQFPNGGTLLLPYDNNLSLVTGEELQMINGIIQNPPSVDYTNAQPSGPNYGQIQTGSFGGQTGWRWALFTGTTSDGSNITCTFGTAVNFVTGPMANFQLFARVSGSNSTVGWINGNSAYSGVGSPTNNGDAACDPTSTDTVKVITFGGTPRNGSVLVRVGLPSGSNKTFKLLTIT